jgi:hypothetical protein
MAAAARDGIIALELRQLLERGERLIGQLDDQRGPVGGAGALDQPTELSCSGSRISWRKTALMDWACGR